MTDPSQRPNQYCSEQQPVDMNHPAYVYQPQEQHPSYPPPPPQPPRPHETTAPGYDTSGPPLPQRHNAQGSLDLEAQTTSYPPPPVYNPASYAPSQQHQFQPPPQRYKQIFAADDDPSSLVHYIRDPHKLVGYLVPFPRPVLPNVDPESIPARFAIYTPPPPPLQKPAEGVKEGKLHKVQRKWQEEVRSAKSSTAKTASWKGAKSKATRGIDWAIHKTTTSNLDFLGRVSPDPQKSHSDDERDHQDSETHKTVAVEEMVLIYPPTLNLTNQQMREEFVNTMLRTKSKAQRDTIIATGLMPVAYGIDILATFIWPFGGLGEIDTVWAYASFRGAKTARSVTKRLASSTQSSPNHEDESNKLKLTFTHSQRLDVLRRYLDAECHKADSKLFPHYEHSPTESEVLEAIGWTPSRDIEEKNWEDEHWEIQEVKEDLRTVFKKAASEWRKWCRLLEKKRTSSGGFLNRVFGGKKEKDTDSESTPSRISTDSNHNGTTSPGGSITVKTNDLSPKSETRKPADEAAVASPSADSKKRRSSSAKAKEIFTQAKNSLIHGDKDGPQTPMQRLSKTDAALSVPQGSLNNSAGESQPTPNSSFLVGVTEDKNKKCRRTMEDTHSYLYNFLGTPAPVLSSDSSLSKKSSREDRNSLSTIASNPAQHVVETDNGYFAIFDGHAGTFAAEWCGKKLHVILEELMRKYPNTPVPELLDQTYTTADNQLERLPLKNSGCTAITAVLRWEDRVPTNHSATGSQAIASLAAAAAKEAEKNEKNNESSKDGKDSTPRSNSTAEAAAAAIQEAKQKATRQRVLYTANVGDARIVLCRNGKALRLSYDHKGMDENEGRRISKAGGLILNNRVNGVLAVTRALGDSYLKDLVTGHPYTTETVIQPDQDEFLILACDGLWDVCSDQEAVDLVRNVHDPQAASKMLVDHALARFSTDNLSVMVVRFDPQKLQQNTKMDIGVETETTKDKLAISEVEMLVGEARRHSLAQEGQVSDQDSEELRQSVIQEQDEEDQETGPEYTPEGQTEAEKILSEKKAEQEKPSEG
ncbi:hypothetical protein AYO21_01443 [Fonsecaea monophora]|uniref:PPM-type phosphatase domain-containing protein n=1 Tax=Fonsecaea monophora TaxID=254056 RepID=A0A177FJS4_9EURO|nr:hypothetical protein AYO21_01443 [Fonsecaea monophora]OAG44447.1 hypothetical protein AYO21_01443 [Fonsecaea monophora]